MRINPSPTKEVPTDKERPQVNQIIQSLTLLHAKVDNVIWYVKLNRVKMEKMMATIDEMNDLVTQQDTKTDSLIALYDSIKQQLADVLSGANLPPDVQAKVDDMFNRLKANVDQTSAAIDAGTEEPETPPVT